MTEAERKAFIIANNALYFDDNSDYKIALWEILITLLPDMRGEFPELKFIDEEAVENGFGTIVELYKMQTIKKEEVYFGHKIVQCKVCKKIIAQCRCMDCNKTVELSICEECKEKENLKEK